MNDQASRPADLVPVAVAAFEEVWRSRDHSLTLLSVLSETARDEAQTRLREAPERGPKDALNLAWGVVWPILERLLEEHEYLTGTIKSLLADAQRQVTHVAQTGDGP